MCWGGGREIGEGAGCVMLGEAAVGVGREVDVLFCVFLWLIIMDFTPV